MMAGYVLDREALTDIASWTRGNGLEIVPIVTGTILLRGWRPASA